MTLTLHSKPGITGTSVLSIPKIWDPVWFRSFINNQLKGADVRNAVGANGITISGNISTPFATIGLVLYPQTAAEKAAGITPANTNYEPWIILRFNPDPTGVLDSSVAIAQAEAAVTSTFVPDGLYLANSIASTALTGNFYGFGGQIQTQGGNKRAKIFSAIGAAPSSLGNYSSIETAFNGDWTHVQDVMEYRITGAATLGQPSTGYVYTPEATPHYTFLYNSSGFNFSTSGNTGRTAAVAYRTQITQVGQGDAVCYNGSVFVNGALPGATNFLANPAGVIFNGDMTAGQAGVYLNPYETLLHDGGFDVAGIGAVYNFDRNNNTGALGVTWLGTRYQSVGTQPVDSIISASGAFANGLDLSLSGLSFGTNQSAISLKAGQRIYLNNASSNGFFTTTWNGDYIFYSTGISGTVIVNGGTATLESTAGQVTSVVSFLANAAIQVNGATPTVIAGRLGIGTTTAGTATAGAAVLPANPLGFLVMNLGGTSIKVPYYSA